MASRGKMPGFELFGLYPASDGAGMFMKKLRCFLYSNDVIHMQSRVYHNASETQRFLYLMIQSSMSVKHEIILENIEHRGVDGLIGLGDISVSSCVFVGCHKLGSLE